MTNKKKVPNDELELLAKKEEPLFLSILLKSKDKLIDAVTCGIKPSFFRFPNHEFLYSVTLKNYESYRSILTQQVFESIIDKQESYTDAQKVKQKNFFNKIYHWPGVNVEDYEFLKRSLTERYLQEQAYNILDTKIPEIVGAISGQGDIVKELQNQVASIEGVGMDGFTLTMGAEEGFDKAFEHIIERRDYPEKLSGIMTGIKAIDDEYYGLLRGSYTVIAGMTNGGKTTLMFNIAFNMARAGYKVVYVSLEKKAVPLYVRLLALHSMVDYNRIKRGGKEDWGLPDHIFDIIQKAKKELNEEIKPNLDIIQMSQRETLTKVLAEVDKVKNEKGMDVLILDYLGCLGFETHHPSRPDLDQAAISGRLQAYGKINDLVTITAIQIKASSTKEIRKKAEKVGDTNDISTVQVNSEDLAGSQEVIRDADNSIGVVLNADKPPTKMFVYSTKARDNEGHKTIVLDFDGRVGLVTDPDLEPGQVQEIDDLVYSGVSTDDLFAAYSDQTDILPETDGDTNVSKDDNKDVEEPEDQEDVEEPEDKEDQEDVVETEVIQEVQEDDLVDSLDDFLDDDAI